jgi:tetratricopeptide (TPR) repeat protein
MYVELLDEVGSAITRAKADSSGRFTFRGLSDGRYKVKVLPYGTDYLEQIQEVVLYSVSAVAGGGADQQQIEIYLRANERANANPFAAAPTVIFAQEVPPEAKKLYEQGLNFLRDKKEKEALDTLRKSIEVFPNYYLALDRLGAEYAMRGASNRNYYEAAVVLLTKAAEVNPRGFSSVFGLGVSQYQLGMINEAAQNLQRAIEIYGKAPDPHLWLGKAQKRAAKLELAEASFKQANTLTGGKSSEVHWQLAGLYSDQKRYAEAADELELFLKLQPKATDGEKIKGLIAQLRAKAEAK